jgi:hypothetical protein
MNGKKIQRFISEEFAKLLDEIKQTRVMVEQDDLKHTKSDWRITLAMTRHPLMIKLKEDIINSDLP